MTEADKVSFINYNNEIQVKKMIRPLIPMYA